MDTLKKKLTAAQDIMAAVPAITEVINSFNGKPLTIRLSKAIMAIPGVSSCNIGRNTHGSKRHYLHIYGPEHTLIFHCYHLEDYDLLDEKFRIKSANIIKLLEGQTKYLPEYIAAIQQDVETGEQRLKEFIEKKKEIVALLNSFSDEFCRLHSEELRLF